MANLGSGDKALPDSVAGLVQRMGSGIPSIEITHCRYLFGMRCPDHKPAAVLGRVRTELFVALCEGSLIPEIEVLFG